MSGMETLLTVFIVVTAVAVVIQMGILAALYAAVKKSSARMESLATEVRGRALPTLDLAQEMLRDYRPKLDTVITNAAEISTTVKQQVAQIDGSLSDIVERTHTQAVRVDELLTRTLDRVEDATEMVQSTVVSPLRQATGVLQGVSAGLATLFGRSAHARAKRGPGTPKDDMFI